MDRIGFGCGRLRGGLEERNSRKLIDAAIDWGIRYFDTAPSYGAGASETILGRALGARRREIQVCSKIGFPRPAADSAVAACRAVLRAVAKPIMRGIKSRKSVPNRRPWARAAPVRDENYGRFRLDRLHADVQESLDALQTEYLDCLMLHEPKLTDPVPELAEGLLKLKSAGIAKRLGVGTGLGLEALPRFGDVAQFEFGPSLFRSSDPRGYIVHGLLRGLNDEAFARSAAESRLIENIPALRTHIKDPIGISALLLNATVLGTNVERVLLSTSSVSRLRKMLTSTAEVFEVIRSTWRAEHEALLADTMRRYLE